MKYTSRIMINKNIKEVFNTYIDYQQMPLWQESLKRIEHDGPIHKEETVSKLIFEFNNQEMIMTETIEKIKSPNIFTAIYQVPGAWNKCVNLFKEINGVTEWTMESEFIFDEENDIPISAFENKTLTAMKIFKDYIENK
ncbi:MAG: hypothetical protein AB7E09_06655 [Candidatus Izemoplasmatales bacterium]